MEQLRDPVRAKQFFMVFYGTLATISSHRSKKNVHAPDECGVEQLAIMAHCLETVLRFAQSRRGSDRVLSATLSQVAESCLEIPERHELGQIMAKLLVALRYGLIGSAEAQVTKREVWAPQLSNGDIAAAAARTLLRIAWVPVAAQA